MKQSWRLFGLHSSKQTVPLRLIRSFTSQPPQPLQHHILVAGAFTKFANLDDVSKQLHSNSVVITNDVVMKVLRSFESDPRAASRFFNWVLENREIDQKQVLGSKGFNKMLCIFGVSGMVNEFWGVLDLMRKNGFWVVKGVRDNVKRRFESDGLEDDLRRLEGVYDFGSSVENSVCGRIARIVKSEVWGDEVEEKIKGLVLEVGDNGVSLGGLVERVLESVGTEEAMKGLIFFRWVEESGLFTHNARTYNVMARILGGGYCIDRFWKVADDMRKAGYEMEKETFVLVLDRFLKRKMLKNAVDLYVYAVTVSNKPSAHDLTFILRKVVASKSLDIGQFSRVVKAYTSNGGVLTNSMFEAVLKSLTSVGRLGECNKVLNVLKEAGFVPSGSLPSKVAYRLSSSCKQVEANQFFDTLEVSGCTLDHRTWTSLIEGHCVAGDLEKATEIFQKMISRDGVTSVDHAFELLANAFCQRNRAIDASKLLSNLVSERELKPKHTTYKLLITKLLVQGGFKEALDLLTLMKTHGFPPFIDPCIEYISRSGNADDALAFLKAMTLKKYPSKAVFLDLFEALFKARRHNEAHALLSKCPPSIRDHADILNLFYLKRSEGASDAAPLAA